MQIIYVHGLNSSHLAMKGNLLKDYCAKNFPEITVHCPNLNVSPDKVVEILDNLIAKDPQNTGLVGSSLGGFFSMIMANKTGCKTVLLNPSTNPAKSLTRFYQGDLASLADDTVLHKTQTGWDITKADLTWLANNRPESAKFPENFLVMLKKGDETIPYEIAVEYFSQPNKQSHIVIDEGGDHRMTDFETKLGQVVQFLFGKVV